jgi:hypothetical protein
MLMAAVMCGSHPSAIAAAAAAAAAAATRLHSSSHSLHLVHTAAAAAPPSATAAIIAHHLTPPSALSSPVTSASGHVPASWLGGGGAFAAAERGEDGSEGTLLRCTKTMLLPMIALVLRAFRWAVAIVIVIVM